MTARNLKTTVIETAIFASLGIAMEVTFTATTDYLRNRDRRLPGQSYVWMLPIYGSIPFFFRFVHPKVSHLPGYLRIPLYVSLLMAGEYASGTLLRRALGVCPWEQNYTGKRWSIGDLVRLDYAPAWALAGYLFEIFYITQLYQPHGRPTDGEHAPLPRAS